MQIIHGRAQLSVGGFPIVRARATEHACAVLAALWTAHPHVAGVSLEWNGNVTVDVVIPADGSLDLHELQLALHEMVRDVYVAFAPATNAPDTSPPV